MTLKDSQKRIRRALYLVLDRLDNQLQEELHDILDAAPAPIIGRSPTAEELQAQDDFQELALQFLENLPPEYDQALEEVMKQVDVEYKPSVTESEPPVQPQTKSPKKKTKKKSSKKKKRKDNLVDYLVILDFTVTCDDCRIPRPPEIIEFPAVLFNVRTGEVEDVYHSYVKPQVNPILPQFCTDVTGITQDMVNGGLLLDQVLEGHQLWLDSHRLVPTATTDKFTFLYTTCGDWDLKVCLTNQLGYHNRQVPKCFESWINLRFPFESMYTNAASVSEMLGQLDIAVENRHQNALDECWDLANVCRTMRANGWIPTATAGMGRIGSSEFWLAQRKREWPPQRDPVTPYKMIYLIHHAQSQGDVAGRKERLTNPHLQDCGLTDQGRKEAKTLTDNHFTDRQLASIELVITSPLKRALQTSILAFPYHKIQIHYDLVERGRDIPENRARPMEDVLSELQDDLDGGGDPVELDHSSDMPNRWPIPKSDGPAARQIRKAFEWIYEAHEEQTIAVVCHSNVIRTAVYGATSAISPEHGVPLKCQLFLNGNLIPV